jgi:hypothetical protein
MVTPIFVNDFSLVLSLVKKMGGFSRTNPTVGHSVLATNFGMAEIRNEEFVSLWRLSHTN